MTTNAIVNAIEWDLENAPKSTTATRVNQRSILEKHIAPLVERIAQLEGTLHHPDDPPVPEIFSIIMKAVSQAFDVTQSAIMKRIRYDHIAKARHAAMNLTKERINWTLEAVGELFDRDHGTVMWAIKAVKDRRATDKDFRRRYAEAERLIDEGLTQYERSLESNPLPLQPIP